MSNKNGNVLLWRVVKSPSGPTGHRTEPTRNTAVCRFDLSECDTEVAHSHFEGYVIDMSSTIPCNPGDTGLEGQLPQCPYCDARISDPDAGTGNTGIYDVICACGAWLELWRYCLVTLELKSHDVSVPPHIFLG